MNKETIKVVNIGKPDIEAMSGSEQATFFSELLTKISSLSKQQRGGTVRSKEVAMPYRSAKVYNDGSHYIAIPQTDNPTRRKKSPTMTICAGTELQTKTE